MWAFLRTDLISRDGSQRRKERKRDTFLQCCNNILELVRKNDAEKWNAARVLSSALNELLVADGEQAVVIIRPLLT